MCQTPAAGETKTSKLRRAEELRSEGQKIEIIGERGERVGVESREREFVLPGLVVAAGQGEDALLENGGSGMVVNVDNPFVQIGARKPFSAASLLELPGNAAMLSVRDEFERGRIHGLLPAEQDAPYVEPEQVFSFAFDSRLLDTHALV